MIGGRCKTSDTTTGLYAGRVCQWGGILPFNLSASITSIWSTRVSPDRLCLYIISNPFITLGLHSESQ